MNVPITYNNSMQSYMVSLQNQKSFYLRDLTQGKISDYFNTPLPVTGILIIYQGSNPVYVGESGNLAQRVGKDIRSIQEKQSNVLSNLMHKIPGINNMTEAREYMYSNYTIKMMRVDSDETRERFVKYTLSQFDPKLNQL